MFDARKRLSQSLQDQCDVARGRVEALHRDSLAVLTSFLDAQYELLRLAFWTTHSDEFSSRGPAQTVIYSALHKNAFLFFASMDLVRRGLYGPSCTLMRPILEGLVCAKYCALSEDTGVFDTWRAGNHASLRNHVLNRIVHPATEEIGNLWDGLNKMAHATKYAQQVTLDFDHIQREIHSAIGIMGILAAFNYHLLTRHFLTSTAIYYIKAYGDKEKFAAARMEARSMASTVRRSFSREGKRFARESCSTWRLKVPRTSRDRNLGAGTSRRGTRAQDEH